MAITTTLTNLIKQVAINAIAPSASTLKIALFKVGASGSYDATYSSPYATGMGGDELPTANGYTQGGQSLTGRSEGPSSAEGWVDYSDAVWTIVGSIAASGAVVYDSTQSNRIVSFFAFASTVTASDSTLTVSIPDSGNGLLRIT